MPTIQQPKQGFDHALEFYACLLRGAIDKVTQALFCAVVVSANKDHSSRRQVLQALFDEERLTFTRGPEFLAGSGSGRRIENDPVKSIVFLPFLDIASHVHFDCSVSTRIDAVQLEVAFESHQVGLREVDTCDFVCTCRKSGDTKCAGVTKKI